ncbi:MAG: hypothetical protein V4641_34100 [Pseudomonadota bacterium]
MCQPGSEPLALNAVLARATAATARTHPVMLPPAPVTVLAGRTLCPTLFEHLALNAAAHTPAGTSIVLGAALEDGCWTLSLEYAGVLPAAQRACLQGPAQRPAGDNALPMYAARLLAQLQGGALSAQDDSARTRLLLRLPAA